MDCVSFLSSDLSKLEYYHYIVVIYKPFYLISIILKTLNLPVRKHKSYSSSSRPKESTNLIIEEYFSIYSRPALVIL